MTNSNGKQYTLFHYVSLAEIARHIARTGKLFPHENDYRPIGDMRFDARRVNLTDVRPEEGRSVIAPNTGLKECDIRYGIELAIDPSGLVRALPYLERGYQIYTREPLDISVLRIWNVPMVEERFKRGWRIVRYKSSGLSYAHWEPPCTYLQNGSLWHMPSSKIKS